MDFCYKQGKTVDGLHWTQDKIADVQAAFSTLWQVLDNEYSLFSGKQLQYGPIEYPTRGLLTNAVDSVILRSRQEAAKFKGLVNLTLAVDTQQFSLTVRDNGLGVAPEVEKEIFHRQISSTKYGDRELIGGAGFHLYSASRMVAGLGGKMGFENKGQAIGAVFWYTIPIGCLHAVTLQPSF